MILACFLILDILISLVIVLFSPLNNYMTSWYYILICLGTLLVVLLFLILLFVLFLTIYLGRVDLKKKAKCNKFDMMLMKWACEFMLMVSNIKLHKRGFEKIPRDKKFLLIQNHLSDYDVLCTTWAFRDFNLTYIFKDSLLNVPFLGKFMHKIQQLAINRENTRDGLRVVIEAINQIKNDERCVAVYPEGTRSKTHELADFHAGTFKIALKAQCPLVISAIINSESKKYHSIFKATHVYIDIVEVLEYDDFKNMTSEELADYAHNKVNAAIIELDPLRDKAYLKKKNKNS